MTRHTTEVTKQEKHILEKLFNVMVIELTETERLLALELKDAGLLTQIEGEGGRGFALTPSGASTIKKANK